VSDLHPHNFGVQYLGKMLISVRLLAQLRLLNSSVPTDFFILALLSVPNQKLFTFSQRVEKCKLQTAMATEEILLASKHPFHGQD
jgi:hypothetical protein